jgi:hypothetical protein
MEARKASRSLGFKSSTETQRDYIIGARQPDSVTSVLVRRGNVFLRRSMQTLREKSLSRTLASWALAVFLGAGLGAGLGCGLTEPPPDSKPLVQGTEAVRDAVALAMDNKDRCLEVGRGGARRLEVESLEYQRNPGAPSSEKSFRHYVEVEAAPELAAASETTKTIDGLLPLVEKEASPELSQAVGELASAQRVICIRAGETMPAAASYENQISKAVYDYESALAAVELRFSLSPGDQALAVARYRATTEEAADRVRRTVERAEEWRKKEEPELAVLSHKTTEELARERREWEEHQKIAAEKEAAHQAALEQWRHERAGKEESAPPPQVATPGVAPVTTEGMRSWHASYAPKAAPVRSALARYLPVARKSDLDTREICQSLRDSTTTLLEDGVLVSPDRRVSGALESAYKEFQGAADACLEGNPLEAHFRLRDGEAALRRAASLLDPYSLRP